MDEEKKIAAEECAATIARTMRQMAEDGDVLDDKGNGIRRFAIPIGEKDGKPIYVHIEVAARRRSGYEVGLDLDVESCVLSWPRLTLEARRGVFDKELFTDMANFAFEDFVKNAKEDAVSRHDAYLAHVIKEFADVDADISEEFAAAQLVAEALSAQACGGWQTIDDEVSTEKLVVFKGDDKILVDMAPVDLSPLL